MTGVLAIGVVAVVFVGLVFLSLNNPMERAVGRALKAQNATPLLEHIEALAPDAQPNMYHRAIGRLWSGHERNMAVEVIRHLVVNHPDEKISQYWLNQVLTVEQRLARENFTEDFLSRYFNPKVASQCGPAG